MLEETNSSKISSTRRRSKKSGTSDGPFNKKPYYQALPTSSSTNNASATSIVSPSRSGNFVINSMISYEKGIIH